MRLEAGEPPVAGGGAALWSEPDARGVRDCLAQIVVAAPALRHSMVAEGVGLAAGVALVEEVVGHPGRLTILGDNLPLIRLGACNARMRADVVWQTVERPLMHLAGMRWDCSWRGVRRVYNTTADGLATRGVHTAVAMFSDGDYGREAWVWVSPSAAAGRGWQTPTALRLLAGTVLHVETNRMF